MQLVNILKGNGNVISQVRLEALNNPPGAGNYVNGILSGAMYYDTTSGSNMFYNGQQWIPVARVVGVTGQTTVSYVGNPVSAVVGLDPAVVGNFLPLSGGTMSGVLYNTSGISATSISATSIYGSIIGVATGALSAAQADKLKTPQNFSLNGFDVSASVVSSDGTGSIVLSANLKPTGVIPSSYGSGQTAMIPSFQVDANGRIISAGQSVLSISGANGGTVTQVGVSSTTLTVGNTPISTSGNINVNLSAVTTAGTASKVTYDQYGRILTSAVLTSSDLPLASLNNIYVPIAGGTMTGNLTAPSATFTSGISIPTSNQGITFTSGSKIYQTIGGVISLKNSTNDISPIVETSAGTQYTIWHAGNLVGTQTAHNHYTQLSAGNGLTYNGTGGFALANIGAGGTSATKVSFDSTGRVTSYGFITSSDVVPLLTASYIQITDKGALGGVAPYDGTGKIYTSALPVGIVGQLHYMGVCDATTWSGVSAAISATGGYYIVNVGSTSASYTLPPGGVSTQTSTLLATLSAASQPYFAVGDWIVSNGSTWDKIDNTDSISSFKNRTGAITPQAGDYIASQITNTPSGPITATNVQTAIDQLASIDATKLPIAGGNMTGALTNSASISATTISAVNIYDVNMTGGKVLVSNADRSIGESTILTGTLNFISAVSADIQMQINAKTPLTQLANYLPLSGGTLTGPLTALNVSATQIVFGSKQSLGAASTTISAGYLGAISYWNGSQSASNRIEMYTPSNSSSYIDSTTPTFNLRSSDGGVSFRDIIYAASNRTYIGGGSTYELFQTTERI
jgi:hypothetical protein